MRTLTLFVLLISLASLHATGQGGEEEVDPEETADTKSNHTAVMEPKPEPEVSAAPEASPEATDNDASRVSAIWGVVSSFLLFTLIL